MEEEKADDDSRLDDPKLDKLLDALDEASATLAEAL